MLPTTRRYAVILSLLHALTAIAWLTYKNVAALLSSPRAICWPFYPGCAEAHAHLTPSSVIALVCTYMALGLVAALLFSLRRDRSAMATFIVASVVGATLYALDYRLRFNQTYMLSWVVIVFLVARGRVVVLQALVASFYVWAGTLKLNQDWVTGAALYAKPLLVPQALVPASCWYVLVLELVLLWGLFARSSRVRWAVLAQLVLFHVVSFGVVGWYYPLLMLGLLAIFPLGWRTGETLTYATITRPVVVTVVVFSLFQLVPYAFPGDTAVTGEGRLFALHMFDARVICSGGVTLVAPDGSTEHRELVDATDSTRSRCDPLTLYGSARFLCTQLASDPRRLDVDIVAHRAVASGPSNPDAPLVRVRDFCHASITYSPWHHNAWIGP